MNFFVIGRKTVNSVVAILVLVLIATFLFLSKPELSPVFGFQSDANEKVREIHMVTSEFKSKTEDGKEIEAYRWDPGTIVIEKGEKVQLIIYGVNGNEHPFTIEGTDIKGTVKKGQETRVDIQFDKEGTYRLICHMHPDKQSNGPMIAYIVVD